MLEPLITIDQLYLSDVPEEKGGVGELCASGGVCKDQHAECKNGRCQCGSKYFFKNGICGQYK